MRKRINPYKQFMGAFVPNFVLRSKDISSQAKLTYGLLIQFAGQDGSCYPSQETIADRLGMSARSVRNYISELEDVGLIEVVQQGLKKTNRYYFLDWQDISILDWQDSATHERQDFATPIERELKKEKSKKYIPALAEVEAYFTKKGYTLDSAQKFYDYYSASIEDHPKAKYWRDGGGKAIKNWKQKAQAVWFKPENKKQDNKPFRTGI